MTLDELRTIVAALEQSGVEYVVIGGAALNAHGIIRATEDVDMMVRATAANIARLRQALKMVWDDPAIDDISVEDLAGDYPVIRYGPPDGTLYLDIVARLGEAFGFDDVESQPINLGGPVARVATPSALDRMKRNTVRDIDRADAATLRKRFGLEDE